MKTKWTEPTVSHLFDAYDDRVENLLGYRPLIADLIRTAPAEATVLDYGCGGGKVSRRLLHAGVSKVEGVDISPIMVAKAQSHSDSS
ncbi:MAG: class I SAM-dependent methyltransferase, partial [Pyrinomonadaceae bacterium]|nr:class I SAM-dependent methyltransferase [Phycisphaerales bacterium]